MAYIEVTERDDLNKGLIQLKLSLNGEMRKPQLEIYTSSEEVASELRRMVRGRVIYYFHNHRSNPYFHVENTQNKVVHVVGNIDNALTSMKEAKFISSKLYDAILADADAKSVVEFSKKYDKDIIEITPEKEEAIVKLLSDADDSESNGLTLLANDESSTSASLLDDFMGKFIQLKSRDQESFLLSLTRSMKSLGYDMSVQNANLDATKKPNSPKVM